MQDPNEDTEWNEILRDFGILPPKEEPKDEIEEMVLRFQQEAMVKPYEKMTLAQLKEAEDEFDEEDIKAIETYREKRLKEWKALKKKQKFGELREISGDQYVNEVTNAEKDLWVIIHLYRSSVPMCLLVNQHLSFLARKFPETKFLKAIVNSCIEHYHDNCLPTIFAYKNGQIEGKFIGIIECGGINLKLEGVWVFCLDVALHITCAGAQGGQNGCQIPWNWTGTLKSCHDAAEIEPKCSERAAIDLNHGTIPLAPLPFLLK